MPEKAVNFPWIWRSSSNPMVQWCFKILVFSMLVGVVVVWGIDGWNNSVNTFQVVDNFDQTLLQSHKELSFNNLSVVEKPNLVHVNHSLVRIRENVVPAPAPVGLVQIKPDSSPKVGENQSIIRPRIVPWVSVELEANYSAGLLKQWLAPGGEPCKDSRTVEIAMQGLDGRERVELSTGDIHEFVFQALDESGKVHCFGGDYFEVDLSGESWKSRPPTKDLGNGTYLFSLQVHPDFSGEYNLTVILLFRHHEGLKFSPERFTFDKVLRVIPIKFKKSAVQVREIERCTKSDYTKHVWSGRWTRHVRNESCEISNDGRYRCQAHGFPCRHPWCDGHLGVLESNGWVYSTHCSFKLVSSEEAWNCLKGRWIFWWGDSNHCDTIRNILHFVLGVRDIEVVPRRFDMNITNPRDPSQTVRFTSVFNGHPNASRNYQGLNSLIDSDYREVLRGFFTGCTVPDTIIMNSGLHDGVYWPNIRRFVAGADYNAAFWAEVVEGVRKRGLRSPVVIYRTTVTTGGYARRLAFNPQKMEAFNGVVLDKLRQYQVVDRVVDDFDMTYPWHYDNRCNDGVHYGRAPLKMKWRDGQIGHQYFVDLMLGHVLLNVLCVR